MSREASGRGGRRWTVLVTDARRGSALAIIRSLGRAGWRVVAADSDPRSLGFRSRHVADRVLYPPPARAPDGVVDNLLRAAREHRVDLLVPVTDEVLHPLSHARERFEGISELALADRDALDRVTDKAKTLELARGLGVPVPRTVVVETAGEAMAAAGALGWPLVVKPAVSRHYLPERGVIEAASVTYAARLEEVVERLRCLRPGEKVLLQEYCRGEGHGVEMLAWRGRTIAAFQHRRLAEIPVSGGASAWRESVRLDPVLVGHATRLVEALRWTGLIMVEFKVGKKPCLMEVNGRVWGSLPLALHAGMDFPLLLAGLYTSGPPEEGAPPATRYREGVRAFDLERILSWMAQVLLGRRPYPFLPFPARREVLSAALGLLDPRQKLDIASLRDPWPGMFELAQIARKVPRKLLSWWRGSRPEPVALSHVAPIDESPQEDPTP